YVERWAYKHPQPNDFFHTMENVSGEDLSWFWRGWFINNWQIDQSVNSVRYLRNDPANGAVVKISNLGRMPMPVSIEIKLVDGTTSRISLPVEIWQRNSEWNFRSGTSLEIEKVTLDPEMTLPDVNRNNNFWEKGTGFLEKDIILDPYLGTFSSSIIPVKLTFTDKDGVLMLESDGQPPIALESVGKDTFAMPAYGIEVKFNEART